MTEFVYDRQKTKKRLWIRIAAAVAAVGIIMFAFIWEASLKRREVPEYFGDNPPGALSIAQAELRALDWVTPMFLPVNEYSRPGTQLNKVNTIVIHYVGNPGTTAEQNRNYFANLAVSGESSRSSNFIVGLDGEIIQCVPIDEVAYASNSRNEDSISIETCHPDETGQFTEETYASVVRLTAWLCEKLAVEPDDIIRHYDITGKECPKYFVDHEDEWEIFKEDVAYALRANEETLAY